MAAKPASASAPRLDGKFSHYPVPRANPSKGEIGEVGRPPKTPGVMVKGNNVKR